MAGDGPAPQHDFLFKLLLIGDSGVGKSNILLRYADDVYSTSYVSTIGVDFKICTRQIGGKIVKMQIWDTAGQEKFRAITGSYYRGSKGIIVVYDVSDRLSFDHVRMWMQEIEKYGRERNGSIPGKLLVGNKCDLPASKRSVSYEEGKQLAEELGVNFIECSAKNAHNIDQTFDLLCQDILPIVQHPQEHLIQLTAGSAGNTGSLNCAC